MPSFDSAKESICSMLESNNYSVRNGKMSGDDFRLFLTPPKFEVESAEVFKLKGNDSVCCGAEIMMGGEMRGAFFKQSRKDRDNLREKIESATGVEGLDFFEIEDDGKDFRVSIRAEFPISKLSEDTFADAMDRLNLAGRSVEDTWNEYFENLIGS